MMFKISKIHLLLKLYLCIIVIFVTCSPSYGEVVLLPGSAQPGLATQNYLPEKPVQPVVAPTVKPLPEEACPELGPNAAQIKFKLKKIILEGNKAYSTAEIAKVYQDKIDTTISLVELQEIVQSITNFYRNNGYILSRAILPPQHVSEGVVRIQVIEGYIDQIKIVGVPRKSKQIILDYSKLVTESRPLKMKDLERYLLLVNLIPGLTVKGVLEPSKTVTAAADLNIVVEQRPFNFSLAYDNYGTLYIGPHQDTVMAAVNSFIRSGDTLRATFLTTTHNDQLRYLDLTYQTPVGSKGWGLTLEGNRSLTMPGFLLQPTNNNGESNNYFINTQYPIILSRAQNLIFDAGFTYSDSIVRQFHDLLYEDNIRSIKAGITYNFADQYRGSNNLSGHIEQGLNIFGASDDPNSFFVSRIGADGIFTKLSAQISRLQGLSSTPFSLFLLAQGQTSNKPLLVFEQFAFGGSVIGRGYDPAELLGDQGIAGSAELRWDLPAYRQLQSLQFYTFYDIGKIWNIEEVPGIPQNQSAASTGFGTRFLLTKWVSGNVMFTQAATKPIASEELRGRGKNPKVFFSLVAVI